MGASSPKEGDRILKQLGIHCYPDVVEYDKHKMAKPVYDHILGCNTMKELGIVLDFRTKQMPIDEIILPGRSINGLAKSKIDKEWTISKSMAQEMSGTNLGCQIQEGRPPSSGGCHWTMP
jgi:hypothetical protein